MKSLLIAILIFALSHNAVFAQKYVGKFWQTGEFISMDNILYFAADDTKNGMELWRSDGTREGTYMLKDIQPGYYSGNPEHFYVYNNELYFSANDGFHGIELWKTDGTKDGTRMFMNLRSDEDPYDISSIPRDFVECNGMLYFFATDTLFGGVLWKTDGTSEGFKRVYISEYTSVSDLTAAGGRLYFKLWGGPNQLWVSDGTAEGTSELPIDDYYTINGFYSYNGLLYVVKTYSYYGKIRVYSLVPGEVEFTLLKEFNGEVDGYGKFTGVKNHVYFSVTYEYPSDTYKDDLWKTDGTAEGTVLVKSFDWTRYMADSEIGNFISFNDTLYFNGGYTNDNSLWRSDGSPVNTKEVKRISVNNYNGLVKAGDRFYFSDGKQLWSSDGSTQGTRLYTEIPGGYYSGISHIYPVNNKVFLISGEGNYYTLWSSDPAPLMAVQHNYSEINPGGNFYLREDVQVDAADSSYLTVINKGLGTLALSDMELTGNSFEREFQPCLIKAGENKKFKIIFFPESAGPKSETLMIKSNSKESSFPVYLRAAAKLSQYDNNLTVNSLPVNGSAIQPVETDTLLLSGNEVSEGSDPGTIVGTFSVKDGENYSYSLSDGDGNNDNNRFTITGNTLKTAATFTYGYQNTHVVRVKAENSNNKSVERNFIIEVKQVQDQNSPVCGKTMVDLSGSISNASDYYCGHFFDDGTGYLFGGSYSGKALKTSNNGLAWQALPLNTQSQIRKCHFLSKDVLIVESDSLYVTKNGGMTWKILTGFEPYKYYSFINLDTIYSASGTEIYKTTDGGHTWQLKFSGDEWIFNLSFRDGELGFASGLYKILRTDDGGETWTIYSHNLEKLFKTVSFPGEDTVLIGGQGGLLFKSTDAGRNWKKIRTIMPVEIIGLQFTNGMKGYSLASNGGGWEKIYRTDDGGENWSEEVTVNDAKGICLNIKDEIFVYGTYGYISKYARSLPPPDITQIIGRDTYCEGEAIAVHVSYAGDALLKWSVIGDASLTSDGNEAILKPGGIGNVTVKAQLDNGCGKGAVGQLVIKKSDMADFSIIGKETVDQSEKDVVYKPDNGSLRNLWYVQGSTYVSGEDPGQISVDWGNGSGGKIELIQTSSYGCRKKAILPILIQEATSEKSNAEDLQINVYPNPVSDRLIIETGSMAGNIRYEIVNSAGTIVMNGVLNGKETINTSDLNAGIYMIRLKNDNKTVIKKLVKN